MINAFLQIKIGRDAKNPLSLSISTYFLLQILLCCYRAGWSGQSLNCLLKKNAQTGQANPQLSAKKTRRLIRPIPQLFAQKKKRAGCSGLSLNCLLKKHRRREELTYIKYLVRLSINTHCFDKYFHLARERRLVRKDKT